MRMNEYHIAYKMDGTFSSQKTIKIIAKDRVGAYLQAIDTAIPELEGHQPYSAWVDKVVYKSGKVHLFNNFEGKPV